MPRQNRVTPLGEVIASADRGLVYGNRGCLHDAYGTVRERHPTRRWIACRLAFRGRRRTPLMAPGRYTELFFLDEATALAAGHRPCAECRWEDYQRLTEVWSELHPSDRGADAIDIRLERERRLPSLAGRRLPGGAGRRLHELPVAELPDGAFVVSDGLPCLVLKDELLVWSPGGYIARRQRPATGVATVITPPSLLALLARGWSPVVPLLHPSATAER